MKLTGTAVLLGLLGSFFRLAAQTPSAADRTLGEVTSLDSEHHAIVLKEDKGALVTVTVGDKAFLLRMPPGETDMKKAVKIAFTDIAVGDRLLAAGAKSGEELEARTVVIMSKADIAQQQRREQEEWRKGLAGIVASVTPEQRAFVVTVGDKKYNVTATDKTEYRRYAADSGNYSDSHPSTLADMKPGDQIRVLGAKDDIGLAVTADRVVFGTFTRVAGVISSVNAETGELKLTDLFSKKPVFIQVTPKSNTRRLPEAMANQIAQRFKPRGDSAGAAPAGRGGNGAGPGRQNTDLSQIVDRLPAITLTDLKTGNALVLTGTPQADASHVTAITIVAGIEPIVTAGAPVVQDLIGGWNLGGGGEGGGEGAQ